MPGLDAAFFLVFTLLTLGGALLTILLRSAVHCALSLVLSLLGVAGLYLLQTAEFLFAAQIIVYIGGITLLFLFVIMLVNLDQAARQRHFHKQWPVALACLLGISIELAFFIGRGPVSFLPGMQAVAPAPSGGNTEQIADVLFQTYLVPFEILSLLLLVAVVGSVFMGRKGPA